MGFEPASDQEMQQRRERADQQHKAHWAQNNYTPRDGHFTSGFERGWADANAALRAGMNLDPDAEKWAKMRAPECKRDEGAEDWEWVHGHVQGQKAAQEAGKNN